MLYYAPFAGKKEHYLPFTWLRVEHASDPISRAIDRVADVAGEFEGRALSRTRSYSTYLVHEPTIHSDAIV